MKPNLETLEPLVRDKLLFLRGLLLTPHPTPGWFQSHVFPRKLDWSCVTCCYMFT